MDFANYTLGRLVPDRSNYDFQNPEYKRVRGQIVGRMLGLGYSLERFGEVDREIASAGYYSGRTDNPDRVDRYGKKYAWIALLTSWPAFDPRRDCSRRRMATGLGCLTSTSSRASRASCAGVSSVHP